MSTRMTTTEHAAAMNTSNYEQGKFCASRRIKTPLSQLSSQSLCMGMLSSARHVMLPRENKASQSRRQISETLQRKWSLEDELNFQYYRQCNERGRKIDRPPTPNCSRSQSITMVQDKCVKTGASPLTPHRSLSVSHAQARSLKQEAAENALVYITPLQRKDKHIRELQIETREKEIALELLEEELNRVLMQKSPEVHVLLDQKNAEIANLNDALQDSRRKYAELEFKSDETVQTVVQCERDIDALKKEREVRERRNQEMYMNMYKKGQQAAKCERLTQSDADIGGVNSDLHERLLTAHREIARLKSSELSGPDDETEAVTTLQMLRTSLFHYLTRDPREAGRHLKALIGMMSFSEEQLEKIAKSVESKRRKTLK